MIFFHDKHWYRSEPLFSVEEEDEDEENDVENDKLHATETTEVNRASSPTPSQVTVTSAPASSVTKKTEYEFLLFNYLLRFVHREGQIGEFARAGLLFLMDVAMSPGEPIHRLVGDDVASSASPLTLERQGMDPVADAALALAEYILDGDFSEVLGAGLGAVYSLLPSKLLVKPLKRPEENGNVMVLGGTGPATKEEQELQEEDLERNRALGLEDASSPDFKARLNHFLTLLEFLQDVIQRNSKHNSEGVEASSLVGNAIVQSILDAVRQIFLENVLYPAVLECSETDGSAVAVMTYIQIMIEKLPNGQLAELLVKFLASEDSDELARSRSRHPSLLNLSDSTAALARAKKIRKHDRRKSSAMALLEMEAPDSRKPSEYFTTTGRFTLKDLILANLRSSSQPTVRAALQLFQTLLSNFCQSSINSLLVVISDPDATSFPEPPSFVDETDALDAALAEDADEEKFVYPSAEGVSTLQMDYRSHFLQPVITFATHEREMGLYMTLISRIDPSHAEDAFSTGYDHYLRDALLSIQQHECYLIDEDAEQRAKRKHRLNASDPILILLLESLRKFFSNAPELNVALTGVLASLAICPDRSLAGWLAFATNDSTSQSHLEAEEDSSNFAVDGDDRSIDFKIQEKLADDSGGLPASSVDEQSRPVVHTIYQALVAQLERYRRMVDHFDQYLLERRQGLLFSENLTDALSLVLDVANQPFAAPPAKTSSRDGVADTPPRPKPISIASGAASTLVSFLTPKKKAIAQPQASTSTPLSTNDKAIAASPFGHHYRETHSVSVTPLASKTSTVTPWIPSASSPWGDDEDVFSSDARHRAETEPQQESTTITLSHLLDNVVILEESIKELVSILHARRSLGIDSIRYI